MSEAAIKMIDNSIFPAGIEAAPSLADLFAKLLMSTGFAKSAAAENREELVRRIEQLCRENKLWIICDSLGPVTLGHCEPDSKEIIGIVTRDNMEMQGYGARMLNALANADPLVKLHPVTKSGKALARKCGFSPMEKDQSTWMSCNPTSS